MENKVTDGKILNLFENVHVLMNRIGAYQSILDGEAGIQVRILEALLRQTERFNVKVEDISATGTPLLKEFKKLEYSVIYMDNPVSPKFDVNDISFKLDKDNVFLKKMKGWNDAFGTIRYEGTVSIDDAEQVPLEMRIINPLTNGNPWAKRVYERDEGATLYLNEKKAIIFPVISPITAIAERAPNYRRGGKKCIEEFKDVLTLYALMKNEKGMRSLYETCDFDEQEGYHIKHNERPKAKLKKMYDDARKLYSREIGLEINRIVDCLRIKRSEQTKRAVEVHNF